MAGPTRSGQRSVGDQRRVILRLAGWAGRPRNSPPSRDVVVGVLDDHVYVAASPMRCARRQRGRGGATQGRRPPAPDGLTMWVLEEVDTTSSKGQQGYCWIVTVA